MNGFFLKVNTKKRPLPFGSGFFANGVKRREVEKECGKTRTALHAFHTYTIPAGFERQVTKIKTNCDNFMNKKAAPKGAA